MAREHGICRQRVLNGVILICLGLLAAGLLVPVAAGAGSADVTQAANTSDESDHETTEVVIDLSTWFDDSDVSISIDLPSTVASWLEVVFADLVELPEPGDSDEPADLPEESEDADDGSDDHAGDDESDDADGESDDADDAADDSADADGPDDGTDDDASDDHDDGDEGESDDDAADDTDDANDESDDQTGADDGADDGDSDGTDDADDGDGAADDQLTHEDRVENAIHDEINQVRAEHGLEALAFDDDLAGIARDHSEDMAERDYFSHTTPEGETVGDRYADAGISCQAWGENILYNYHGEESPQVIAERSVQQWMNSDGHRANILSEQWDSEGIGVAVDGSEVYVTQNFGTNCS